MECQATFWVCFSVVSYIVINLINNILLNKRIDLLFKLMESQITRNDIVNRALLELVEASLKKER
jgi:hypothetical protein